MGPKFSEFSQDRRKVNRNKGEGYGKMQAETRVVLTQAKGHLEPPVAERGKERFSLSAVRIPPQVHTSDLQKCERINFSCFKPANLW